MKVLLVSDYGRCVGGAETTMRNLRTELQRRGHTVRWFASRAGPRAVSFEADEGCFGTISRWRTLVQTWNPWAARRLRAVLTTFRPDVVHLGMFLTQLSPAVLPVLRGWPVVWHVSWYRGVCPTGLKWLPRDETTCTHRWGAVCYRQGCVPARDWPFLMWQMRQWWRHHNAPRRVVVESDAVGRMLGAHGIDVTDLVPPGVVERPARPPLGEKPVVAYAGRLTREKGVDVLLAALREVAGVEAWIVGDGPQREVLEAYVRQWGLVERVHFTGHRAHRDAEAVLERAWIQVVPSRWAEPFGLVAVEAMMRGTAVVASAMGGLAEIVEHEQTGLLVPVGNVSALADAIQRATRDRELVERWGRAARERALQLYRIEQAAAQWERIYQSVRENERVGRQDVLEESAK